MASFSSDCQEQLVAKFEKWLGEKLKSKLTDETADIDVFLSYFSSTMTEEDNTDDEKREAVRPFLQELNQKNVFNEEDTLDEIITSWNKLKIDFSEGKIEVSSPPKKEDDITPTDTILSMINKHKTQVVAVKKVNVVSGEDDLAKTVPIVHRGASAYNESDDDEEEAVAKASKKDSLLFVNTNAQDAQSRQKQVRDQLSEAHHKQKEQAKKALIEQKQKEEDRKKKAQQKAAKVERKR